MDWHTWGLYRQSRSVPARNVEFRPRLLFSITILYISVRVCVNNMRNLRGFRDLQCFFRYRGVVDGDVIDGDEYLGCR